MGFNRNIMGCKDSIHLLGDYDAERFNRNIMGCKAKR